MSLLYWLIVYVGLKNYIKLEGEKKRLQQELFQYHSETNWKQKYGE